tara:strand:- start:2552 stop:3367 length:816 start_codon:yes stop_codon:yes gene_type:complete
MNAPNCGITFDPITPHLGAMITGVDFSRPLDTATHDAVLHAMADHLVLVAKEQNLMPEALRDLATSFGPAHLHHPDDGVIFADGMPEVLELRRSANGEDLFGGGGWHADVTFLKPAGYFSFLNAKVVPEVGGDTGFASTVTAFSTLSPAMQALLRDLKAVHSYDGPGRPEREGLTSVHPVVRRHPISSAEGLYLNTMFVTRFENMSVDESRPLIDFLDRHMTQLAFTCRVRWKPNQLVIWDNRFTLHLPCDDFTGQPRHMIRCATLEPEAS